MTSWYLSWYRIRKPPFSSVRLRIDVIDVTNRCYRCYKMIYVNVHTISRRFKNLLSGECFWKDAFSLTVFTGYVWTVAVVGRGEGPRGPGAPLFLDQTEARRAGKKLGRPGPPYLRVWMTAAPLSDGLNPPLSWPNRGENWSRFQTDTCGRGLRKKLYKKIHKEEIYIRRNKSTFQVSY